jgi:phage-related protein (TIGR01555 family)
MRFDFWRRPTAPVALPPAPPVPPRRMKIPDYVLAATSAPPAKTVRNSFEIPAPPPGALPEGVATMAMDAGLNQIVNWAGNLSGGDGMHFIGYTYLAELSQRAEFRRLSEVVAKEMTRKWIKLQAIGDESKADKIKQLTAAMKRHKVQDKFRRLAELDGFFGRAHLYIDTGATDNLDELKTKLLVNPAKIGKGSLKGFRVVEPIWVYPSQYNSTDPLRADFYRPQAWYVMGKEVHASRLLTVVGREMPDLLKPAYMFGGLSLTQMAKECVDLWLKDRESVSELVDSFSTNGIMTDLSTLLLGGGGEDLIARMQLYNQTRENRGLMVLNKDTEEFFNVSVPLSGLDKLQAQSQEHICAISGVPLVVYTGITPAGLNASSDSEIRVWYDNILSSQEDMFADTLATVIQIIQLDEFGEIDEAITHEFVSLWQLDDAGKAAVQKTKADTAAVLIQEGVIDPLEERGRIATDPESLYAGLNLSGPAPTPPDDGKDPSLDDDADSIASGGARGGETGANSGV